MMRSLYSGVTGLRNHQTRMDVIGNNIANVNTVGFKGSRVIFQDIYSNTIKTAAAPDANNGGTNPQQVGLGVSIAAIDVMHTKGAPQYTGEPLDFSIDGEGYFIISDGSQELYTRAGNFYISVNNYLVTANGAYVQGYGVDAAGDVDYGGGINNLLIDPNYYDVTIDKTGLIIALDGTTNARTILGQLALSTFSNVSGLEKNGNNTYVETVSSGPSTVTTPGSGGGGLLNPGTLEMANVDLANEFTDMIVTQRGFQANSRIITVSDSMLEELVNLKR